MKLSDPRDNPKGHSKPPVRIVFDPRDSSPRREMAGGAAYGRKLPIKKGINHGRDPSLREKLIRTNINNGTKGEHRSIYPEQPLPKERNNGPREPDRFHPERYFSPQTQRKKYVGQWNNLRPCISRSTGTLAEDVEDARFTPALRQKSVTFSDEIIVHD